MIRNQKGQSTVEFLSSFAFIISILFLYVKMALNITNGYLLHHATYLASRTYLVAYNGSGVSGGSDTYAKQRAQEVFDIFTDWYIGLKSGPTMNVNEPTNSVGGMKAVFVGIRGEIEQTFSLSKIIGGTKLMKYISESFLGREPFIGECLEQVCHAMIEARGAAAGACSGMAASTLVDNGC